MRGKEREREGGRGVRGEGIGFDEGKGSILTALGAPWFFKLLVSVCLVLNSCNSREWGERYCDTGRECAIERKHLSEGWGGCYGNYLYSRLSVMFHWSLERRRGMKGGEELRKEGLVKGHFSICLPSPSVNLTVRLGDKDKL